MKIKYDKEADVLYFEFEDTTVTTKRVTDEIAIDYDAAGKVAGIEVLAATRNILSDPSQLAIEMKNIGQLRPAGKVPA